MNAAFRPARPEGWLLEAGNLAVIAKTARAAMAHYQSGPEFDQARARFDSAAALLVDLMARFGDPAVVQAAKDAVEEVLR